MPKATDAIAGIVVPAGAAETAPALPALLGSFQPDCEQVRHYCKYAVAAASQARQVICSLRLVWP